MKKGGGYIVAALLLYVFFLITTLPAGRALHMIRQAGELPEGVQVGGVAGTWLAGRATLVEIDNFVVNSLVWRIRLLPFFVGRLQSTLAADIDGGRVQAVVSVGRKDLLIKDLIANVPATLANEYTAPFGLALEGDFEVDIGQIRLQNQHLQAIDGNVSWRKAGLGGSQELDFGDIEARFSAAGGKIDIKIKDSGGPLQLEGAADLSPGGQYSFTGFVAVRSGATPELTDAVRLLGESGSDGRVALSYRGRVPDM